MNTKIKAMTMIIFVSLSCPAGLQISEQQLLFDDGTLSDWTAEPAETWQVLKCSDWKEGKVPEDANYLVHSRIKGESATGTLRSGVFEIIKDTQRFYIAGADGTEQGVNDAELNYVYLKSWPNGEILRKAHTPNNHLSFKEHTWYTGGLIGQKVYLEITDNNPSRNPAGFAWIAFGGYRQQDTLDNHPVDCDGLYALKIDANSEDFLCRSVPFLAAQPDKRGQTIRTVNGKKETIPVNAKADTLYLLGMVNWGWDYCLAHWGEHPELWDKPREDQIYIGIEVGKIEIHYASGKVDTIPVQMGSTMWMVKQWSYGPDHMLPKEIKEPFASRPEYEKILRKSLRIKESTKQATNETLHCHYYLPVKVRPEKIESIVVIDNTEKRGKPLVSAITLKTNTPADHLISLGKRRVDKDDIQPAFKSSRVPNFAKDLKTLSNILYTAEKDLPKEVDMIDFPDDFDAARIRFIGDRFADMLSNIWVANIMNMDEKFEADTGYFHETTVDSPFYGGYMGLGSWAPVGIYHSGAFSRTSDHYATLALRCLHNNERVTNYVDFVDKWFYFYRNDHDPNNGPDNSGLDIDRYPNDAPGHWAFVVTSPLAIPFPINEIPGDEEMDGHGATMVGRWVAWRLAGGSTGDWLIKPRENVFQKTRWDTTRDAAEFVCWLMDYTGMDVVWSESEFTGWAGGGVSIPKGMADETDPKKIRQNYANSDMYEVYPSYTCMTGLLCSAQIAENIGENELAQKWRDYAERIRVAMLRLLDYGPAHKRMWRVCPYSVLPSMQDSLVQLWFSHYLKGLDPKKLNPELVTISQNTLERQLNEKYGDKPVLAMGYGIGWLTHAALVADQMDNAGRLLINIAKYSYDKNMEYYNEKRGIDWREHLWMIPEGSHVLPDGRWYRICDLGNGANQGPAMHALNICAGIDDSDPQNLKILPRVPDPLTALEITNYKVLIPAETGLDTACVNYIYRRGHSFELHADKLLPTLSIRFGPYESKQKAQENKIFLPDHDITIRIETSGRYKNTDAWWLWCENLKDIEHIQINLQ